VTPSLALLEAAMRVKSTHLIKACVKTRNKRENMEIEEIFLHKTLSDRSFRHRIHSLLRRADAEGSADN